MVQPTTQNPPNTPLWKGGPALAPEWWRFFFNLNRNTAEAAAGEVATGPGSGLTGGGAVADGISISIAPNGVTNNMLRESAGTSVIGRFQGSSGNVADITATGDNRVLTREGGALAFRSFMNGVAIGPTTPSPTVNCEDLRCDTFRIDQAPVAETVVCTHTITISVNGTNYKIPIIAA
jgi:hypothetical protein